jgi:ABC-type sugar transport system permease subunit
MLEANLTSPAIEQPTVRRRSLLPTIAQVRENFVGHLFVLPATVIIFLFGLFPIIYASYMSLHRWRVRKGSFYCAGDVTVPEGVAIFSPRGLSAIAGNGELGLLLSGCMENYTEVVGNWWGALAFAVGFGLLVLAYWLWNNAFKRIETYRWAFQLVMAFVVVGVGLFSIAYGWGLMMDTGDDDFLQGLAYTFYYAFGSVPFQLGLGLVLAYILFQNLRGRELFRMIFFLPYVTPRWRQRWSSASCSARVRTRLPSGDGVGRRGAAALDRRAGAVH